MVRYDEIMREIDQLTKLFHEEYTKGNVIVCVHIQDDISKLIYEASTISRQIMAEADLTYRH